MFVKLVVVDDREYDDSDWSICCGAAVYDHLSENLVGDDRLACPRLVLPDNAEGAQVLEAMQAHDAAHRAWHERHFPNWADESAGEARYRSRPYVASMLVGISGWSGYDDDRDEYWHCTPEDLTQAGKALYAAVEALYPGCTLHLLTFLDT